MPRLFPSKLICPKCRAESGISAQGKRDFRRRHEKSCYDGKRIGRA